MSADAVDELVAAWTADMQDASKDETAREKWLREQLAAERKRREGVEDELHEERLAHTAAVTRAEQAERDTAEARALYQQECAWRAQAELERDEARQQAMDRAGDLSAACRERDEASARALTMCRVQEEEMQACQRAEADNAALLADLRSMHDVAQGVMRHEQRERIRYAILDRMDAPHPGAALLEEHERRRQLLEAVAKACRGLGPVTPEVQAVVGRTLERMRALEALANAVREYLSPTFPSTVGDLFPVRKALAAFDALKVSRE